MAGRNCHILGIHAEIAELSTATDDDHAAALANEIKELWQSRNMDDTAAARLLDLMLRRLKEIENA